MSLLKKFVLLNILLLALLMPITLQTSDDADTEKPLCKLTDEGTLDTGTIFIFFSLISNIQLILRPHMIV